MLFLRVAIYVNDDAFGKYTFTHTEHIVKMILIKCAMNEGLQSFYTRKEKGEITNYSRNSKCYNFGPLTINSVAH